VPLTPGKWDGNGDWSLLPSRILIHPFSIISARTIFSVEVIPSQFCIYLVPLRVPHIIWAESRATNNVQKLTKTLVGFLSAVAPIPIPKTKRRFIRVRVEIAIDPLGLMRGSAGSSWAVE